MICVLYVLGALVAIVFVLNVAGLFLSKAHEVTRSIVLPVRADEVWRLVTDFAHQDWRSNFGGAERLPDEGGKPVWREKTSRYDTMLFRTDVEEAPIKLVRTIADPKSPFTGAWTYAFEDVPEGCRLTLTERGEVKPPLFRVLGRFMNLAATVEGYLRDLQKKIEG